MLAVIAVSTVALDQTVYGQTTVQNTLTIDNQLCGIDPQSTTLDFGTVTLGSQSLETISLPLENTGNADADVEFWATNWVDAADLTTAIMDGENTRFATTGPNTVSYAAKTPSNSTLLEVPMGKIFVGNTNATYWQVDTSLISGQELFQGPVLQTMSFVATCQ